MADFVDIQYVNMLSNRFERFSIKSHNPLKINFRCPICNDSKKSKTKSRGWITENKKTADLFFRCFNCGESLTFSNFLKEQDPILFRDYIAEKYIQKTASMNQVLPTAKEEPKPEEKIIPNQKILSKLKRVSQLKADHPVKKYIEKRKIPSEQHYRLYYAPKFMTWINSLLPDKFEHIKKDEPRLVIPLCDKNGYIFGVSARSFDPKSDLRYITIMFKDKPKLFGLDTVNFNKDYVVVEGALDSLFLKNSMAMVGADTAMTGLEQIENAIFCHDAEPRNLEICKRMEKLLKYGYRVCIWPPNMPGKDINDLVLNGMSSEDILKIIKENTYNGLEGLLKLNSWKKV